MRIFMLSIAAATFFTATAWANHNDYELEQLIRRCRAEEANTQNKPFQTQVFCRGKKTYWIEKQDEPGEFGLKTTYQVVNSASMKDGKYKLSPRTYLRSSAPSQAQCRTYQEMLIDIANTVTLFTNCGQLEEMAAEGRGAFCERILEGADDSEGTPTGRIYTTCPDGNGHGGGHGGGHGDNGGNAIKLPSRDLGLTFEATSFALHGGQVPALKVAGIRNSSLAGLLNIQLGNILVFVHGKQVSEPDMVHEILQSIASQQTTTLTLWNTQTQSFEDRVIQLP